MKTYLFIGPLGFQGCVFACSPCFLLSQFWGTSWKKKKRKFHGDFVGGQQSWKSYKFQPPKRSFYSFIVPQWPEFGLVKYQTHIMPKNNPLLQIWLYTHLWGPTAVHRWAKETGCFLCEFDWPSSLHLLHMRRGEPWSVAGVIKENASTLGMGAP